MYPCTTTYSRIFRARGQSCCPGSDRKILRGGMECYLKHYELVVYLVLVLLIKDTPFELVYGQEAVFPVEVNLDAYRLAKQNDLSAVDYYNSMMDNIDEVTDK